MSSGVPTQSLLAHLKTPTQQFARAPIGTVAARNMRAYADVLTRIAILQKNALAKSEAEAALKVLSSAKEITATAYAAFLKKHFAAIRRIVASHSAAAQGSDPFDIVGALKELDTAIAAGNTDALAAAHNALNERLDAHLTMLVRP